MIEVRLIGKNDITEQLFRVQTSKVARAKSFSRLSIIRAAHERAPTDYGETLTFDLNGNGKALQSRMAAIVNNAVFRCDAAVGYSAIRIAKANVLRR